MSGDIFDDKLPFDGENQLIEDISKKYPCYYVTGNHEFWSGRVEVIKEIISNYGVNVLEGISIIVENNGQFINICGVDDPSIGGDVFYSQLANAFENIDNNYFTILVSHRPELVELYNNVNCDLVVSWHAHGGQFRIPFTAYF